MKGYIFMGRIIAAEGADNHPRLIAETAVPLPHDSVMGNQVIAKSLVGSSSMDLVRQASERERGQLQFSGKDLDCAVIADLLSALAAKMRNTEYKSVKLSKVEAEDHTHISISIVRK